MLAAMGLVEWRLLGTRGVPRAGLVQIGALFLGGVILAAALLFSIDLKIAGGLNILCELVAVGIFIKRLWPTALRAPWMAADGRRHLAFAALVIPFSMAILIVVIATVAGAADPTRAAARRPPDRLRPQRLHRGDHEHPVRADLRPDRGPPGRGRRAPPHRVRRRQPRDDRLRGRAHPRLVDPEADRRVRSWASRS